MLSNLTLEGVNIRFVLFASVISIILYIFIATFQSRDRKALATIPGPRGLPIIGNTLQFGQNPHRRCQEWAAQYGELFKIRLGWENWVFLNSPEAVKEILDKQSAITSGRQPMPVLSDLVSGGKRFLFMTYSPQWRKLRTIVHKLLTPKVSSLFKPSQEFEAKQLLFDILTDNKDQASFYMHVRRYTTSVVMTSTYGRRVPKWDCEDTREIYGLMQEFSECAPPNGYLADLLPPLSRLPTALQWWRPSANRKYERQRNIWMKYWNTLTSQMAAGDAPECFVKQFAEGDYKKQDISEAQAAFVAGTMIEAGSETTSSALNSAIKYLAKFPEAQMKAHEELSRVVGNGRVPTFDDEDALPFIRATVKEVLRIRPVTNIGSPHYTTADVVYKGYVIPKNTIVSLCQYSIHFDPKKWQRPDDFDPTRYLSYPLKAGAYAAAADPNDRDHFDFGAGRRICPGLHLAENSLFITIACILWLFEIKPAIDDHGSEEEVDVSDAAYDEGVNTLPKPYKIRFVPRNEKRVQTLQKAWTNAQRDGFHLGSVKVNVDGMVR
ncbi:putative O-methylsterigmatocystin oxidoreductase [Paraphoma chrysanthemicola]|uniref:O-methylsterigmatocystin oxidoreductase n=1 Tax=Paraphoma chrysanthemicola TaxID=798071 RepID=A0A8K0RF03_9PLEO|nr:putative O-methylsterigmatocystin oxidoreductase [Paraphoma chrysanthemicola]